MPTTTTSAGSYLYLTDHLLTLTLVEGSDDTTPVTTADPVQCTIYWDGKPQTAGNEVGGQSWPQEMTHQGAGVYTCNLADTLDVRVGDKILIVATAEDGANRKGTWHLRHTITEG